MKKFLLALLLVCGISNAQTVTTPTFYDDSYVQVPLQFGFPFYGRVFTNSWMHSNGVVSFLDPAVPIPGAGYNPGQWAYCCSGVVPTETQPQFSYMIAPLWTDLYPVGSSTFRTEGTSTYQKYFWNNIAEISNMSNLNSFSLEIRPTGYIGATYSLINIQNQHTWIGTIGDTTKSEWNQIYYGRGVPSNLNGWSLDVTNANDMCSINPLYSTTCAGYTDAMCAANPLYSTTCSGYAAAYYTQQCSLNSLFDVGCPGYAAAYLDYQCSLDPLYSTTCRGYEQAYFNQQCTINQLYSTQCPGYAEAYFDQQCSLDGLYDKSCPNYAQAYALKYVVPTTTPSVTTTTTASTTEVTPTVSSTGAVTTTVSATGDATVDAVIKSEATSTTSATATVQLAPATTSTSSPTATTQVAQTEQKKEATKDDMAKQETKKEDSTSTASSSSSNKSDSGSSSGKETKTARQEVAEKRAEARKQAAVAAGKQAAEKMEKASSLEAQVAVQNVVIAAMGFTPGFQAYNVIMPDGVGYKPFTVYKNQKTVDNARVMRGLSGASDKIHEQMVASQWETK